MRAFVRRRLSDEAPAEDILQQIWCEPSSTDIPFSKASRLRPGASPSGHHKQPHCVSPGCAQACGFCPTAV